MYYALIYKPNIDTSKIDYFQKQYDPYYRLAGVHFTLIFPTPDTIEKQQLINHIKSVLKKWKPFKIHINGLEKSWDHWLLLNAKEGNDQFTKLHDELYTGLLEPYWRKDLPYSPHISLGLFVKDKDNYDIIKLEQKSFDEAKFKQIYEEAQELNLDYYADVDELQLFTLNDDLTKVIAVDKFPLD